MTETRDEREIEVLLVTGMSGAGKSTAANVLEDLDWYVVDNLPAQMIPPLIELVRRAEGSLPKVAIVSDVRGRAGKDDTASVTAALDDFLSDGVALRVLFLDASDEVLVRRFESVRRPHPLQDDGTLLDGISAERTALENVRHRADLVVDTSELNVHQLAAKIRDAFDTDEIHALRLTVMSFGFKNGIPADADHVADIRFLPNPHWVPELRPFTGLDSEVSDFVLAEPSAAEFIDRYVDALEVAVRGYLADGRTYATIAVGCTGGKHRSVAVAERLACILAERTGVPVSVRHRDLGRE